MFFSNLKTELYRTCHSSVFDKTEFLFHISLVYTPPRPQSSQDEDETSCRRPDKNHRNSVTGRKEEKWKRDRTSCNKWSGATYTSTIADSLDTWAPFSRREEDNSRTSNGESTWQRLGSVIWDTSGMPSRYISDCEWDCTYQACARSWRTDRRRVGSQRRYARSLTERTVEWWVW